MKKVLLLGSNTGSLEMIKYLKENGCYVIVTDYLPPALSPAKILADEYWNISTTDVKLLHVKCREKMVDAVLTGTGEQNIESAIKLTKKLGFPFYTSEKSWKRMNNKLLFKQLCKQHGLPIAKEYSEECPPKEAEFPIVVKPADNCFNRGLTICKSISEFNTACRHARNHSPGNQIVVEKFIEGKQINIFYHMAGGKIGLSCVTESLTKKGTPSSNYTVTLSVGDYTDSYLKLYDKKARDLLKHLECLNGTVILQAIANKEDIFFLEVNYRLDGLGFYNTLKDAYGIDAVKIISDLSLEGRTDFEIMDFSYTDPKVCCIYSIWTYQKCKIQEIVGVEKIKTAIKNVHIQCRGKSGMEVNASKEEGALLFNICFYESSMDEVIADLKLINKVLFVYDENRTDILEKFRDYG